MEGVVDVSEKVRGIEFQDNSILGQVEQKGFGSHFVSDYTFFSGIWLHFKRREKSGRTVKGEIWSEVVPV